MKYSAPNYFIDHILDKKKMATHGLVVSTIIGAILTAINMFIDPFQMTVFVLSGFVVMNFFSLYLVTKDHLTVAIVIMLFVSSATVIINMVIGEGLSDPGIMALPAIVTFGGLFLGRRSIWPLIALCVLTVIGLTVLEQTGILAVQRATNTGWSVIFTVLLLGYGLIAYIIVLCNDEYRTKVSEQMETIEQQKAELARHLEDKDILIKEIYHRVKNNLQMVSFFLHLQETRVDTLRDRDMMEQARKKITAMGLIHEKLYQSEDLKSLNVSLYLEEIILGYESDAKIEKRNIRFTRDFDDLSVTMDQAMPLAMIINELISNSFKYAVADDKVSEISVSFRSEGHRRAQLIYTDNGPGYDPGKVQRKSLGTQLIAALARQLKADIFQENREGFYFSLSLYLPSLSDEGSDTPRT